MMSGHEHPWYCGLFGDSEIAAILAPEEELSRMLRIEAAWTRALGEVEGAPEAEDIAKKIERFSILPTDLLEGTSRDGIPIPALVAKIKQKLNDEKSNFVHQGLTSQDVMDTSLILAINQIIPILMKRLAQLVAALTALAEQATGREIIAYTRMQPALPVNAEKMIEVWRRPFAELEKDLKRSQHRLSMIQWGGPIGQRDHPTADKLASAFAENLGLKDQGHAWHTDRSAISELATTLSRICNAIGKIGDDVAFLAAVGDGNLILKGSGNSSAMTHKSNPITAEALGTLGRLCAVQASGILQSGIHENFRSGTAWMLETAFLNQIFLSAGAATRLAKLQVSNIVSIGLA